MERLTAIQSLDHETMWRMTSRLVDRLFGALEREEGVLDDSLDILVDILGADRGLIVAVNPDGTTRPIHARAQKQPLSTAEREEISKTILHDALEQGRCVQFDPLAGAHPSESVALLGIVFALAAPLRGPGGKPRGVLYVDIRDRRKFIEERHVEFFMTAAALIGALLEQHERGETTRDQLREARSHCTDFRSALPLDVLLGAPSMAAVRREVDSAIEGSSPILVLGDSGTGKTLLAQSIAERSKRRPIVRAMLGSSDDLNTITSELFGHERGAFSGAAGKRVGLVEFADGGTLILDEILNLPPHAQRLLLDFTQFGTYRPLGYDKPEPKRANVRIIAATNGDLALAIRERRFREDLFYRLAGLTVEMPPLRDRRDDIPSLAEGVLKRADPQRTWTLSVPLRRLLVSPALGWSGNVRQLERVIQRARERAVARDSESTVLTTEHIEPRDVDRSALDASADVAATASSSVAWQKLQTERDRIDEREQSVIRKALADAGGVVAYAARDLGVARTTLASRISALGIRAPKP